MKSTVSCLLLLISMAVYSQPGFQNLDFEVMDEETAAPEKWYVVDEQQARYTLDNTSYSGQKSLLLWPQTPGTPCDATWLHTLESAHVRNKKKVRITARVKCADPECQIFVFVRQLSPTGQELSAPPNRAHRRAFKKNEWDTIQVEQPINPAAEHFAFGLTASGNDSMRIDAVDVYLDETKMPDARPQTMRTPAPKDLRWMEEQGCLNFATAGANRLKPLREALKNEHLVGLGEETHGSSEVYEVKSRIIQFMVEELGFDILAMEMDTAAAESLNAFLVDGKGDIRTLLGNITYWPWRTEEFLGLLNWMRDFNTTHVRKIQLKGIDVSGPHIDSLENNPMMRDEVMAGNVSLLIKQNPRSKIVIWAHNAHISKGDYYALGMGEMLAKKYAFFSIGFALGSGQFNAVTGPGGSIVSMNLTPPIPGSYEFWLSKSSCPVIIVDLRLQKRNNRNPWLFDRRKLRYVGAAVVLKYQFVPIHLSSNFDGLVFISKSSPSRLLK